jgi:arylsulfatase A-like enzyme
VPQRPASPHLHIASSLLLLLCALGCGQRAAGPPLEIDLTEIFPLAELETETQSIDFGAPEARPFLLEGWSFNQHTPDGTGFVWGLGERSRLRIWVGEPRDLRLRFHSHPGPIGPDEEVTLEVRVAGQTVGVTTLRPGAAWYSVPLPGALLVPGENVIELVYGHGDAAAPQAPRREAVAIERLEVVGARSLGLPEAKDGALRVPFHSGVVYYWRLPEGGELSFAALEPWAEGGAAAPAGSLEVELRREGQPPQRSRLEPSGSGELTLALPAAPEGPVRVALRARSAGAVPETASGLDLVAPRLRMPAAAHVEAAPDGAPHALPNVFVYMIDTLRPDHLGAYGYPRPTSPHIDAFAHDATLFLDAVAQTSWTRPAVASVFTGLHPPSHGVVRANRALADDLPSLPAVLQGIGYQTWGIVTNGNVAPDFGFGRGFERYRYLPEGQPVEVHQLSDAVNELAFDWLERRRQTGPLFLYLHTTDPHSPYTPRSPYREALAGAVRDPEAGSRPFMRRLQLGEPAGPGTQAEVRELYDAEIAFNDASFGTFIAKLKELGLYDASLIVLLSDHGESFAEHGSWQHGTTLYQEVVEIPLIVKFPNGLGRGQQVETTARQVDLLPTVLDVLGQAPLAGLEGRSLLPEVAGDGAPETPITAFSHLARRRGVWESASQGRHKLIRTTAAADGSARVRLFELEDDPLERRDVAAQRPVWRGYLLSQLRHLDSLPRREGEAPAPEIDPALRERLEALGYM